MPGHQGWPSTLAQTRLPAVKFQYSKYRHNEGACHLRKLYKSYAYYHLRNITNILLIFNITNQSWIFNNILK